MKDSIRNLTKTFGLHPLVGFGMIAVDWMLFGGDFFAGIGWMVTIPLGLLLGISSVLIQKNSFDKDNPQLAWGKAIVVGVLTAIPTPLPSIITLGGAVAGTAYKLLERGEDEDVIEGEVIE